MSSTNGSIYVVDADVLCEKDITMRSSEFAIITWVPFNELRRCLTDSAKLSQLVTDIMDDMKPILTDAILREANTLEPR